MTTPNTQGASWEELQYEVLEDYIREAEMSYALHNGKDAAYYERMRGHFEKLKAYVSKERAEGERRLRERLAKEVERGFENDPKPPGSPMYSRGRRDAAAIIRTLPADSTERN